MSPCAPRVLLLSVVLPLVLLASGCGGDSPEAQSSPTTTAASVPPAASPSAAPSAAPAVPDGEVYTDDDGFRITFPSSWTVSQDVSGLQVAAVIPEQTGNFSDNVGVISEETEQDDLTLERYLDLSVEAAPKLISNFTLVSRDVRTVDDQEQGVLEYTGNTSGYDLHFLAVVVVDEGKAFVATLTATPDTYASRLAGAEPVLASLHTA